MELSIRVFGKRVVELTVSDDGWDVTSDVADAQGIVDIAFIENLRDVADELEKHNIWYIKKIHDENTRPAK